MPLREIVMEPTGSVRALGGLGRSGSDPLQPRLNSTKGNRADNSNWFDDTSDGLVCATIELGDGTTATCSAWVITAPPDFAPGIKNLIALYDALYDVAVRRGVLTAPTDPPHRPSFAQHIQPILSAVPWDTSGLTGSASAVVRRKRLALSERTTNANSPDSGKS